MSRVFSIPYVNAIVLTGRGQFASIGGPEDGMHQIVVTIVCGHDMSFIEGLPDLDGAVFAC
jgi:hypothetical protein